MAKKTKNSNSSDNKLFSLLLPATAIIVVIGIIFEMAHLQDKVRIPKLSSSAEYGLKKGWNPVSFPLKSSTTANMLCQQTRDITRIARMSANKWQYYNCTQDVPADNFLITSNEGYMLEADADTVIPLKGDFVRSKLQFKAGLNLVGISNSALRTTYANELCHTNVDDNLEIVSVGKWENGRWNSHLCANASDNNFELAGGRAYLVTVSLLNSPEPAIPPLQ